ncbi:sulfite exporter TauE/SafE family protein [Nannocystis sp. SCPEA4]|uniref:sulfite exporter TauE/SafE family protein n=1 Tax=Nannocystis sp. SCPEA4 TaxID=2996787 RepID=UPI00226D4306|nr:sulfite exporter TauE/SafE family protein [Nannocystis sp. SCPEA4]
MSFELMVAGVAVLAGATAAVAGAGIGSMLVPLLALRVDFKVAVALAAIPHLVGGALRLIPLRRAIDWRLLRTFGLACAATALLGALLSDIVGSRWVTRIFAVLLALAGVLGLTGVGGKWRPGKVEAWIGGALSGLMGGLAGEQGGIRAVALLCFGLPRDAFVATSTAVGVMIDLARVPVYVAIRGHALEPAMPLLLSATGGVVAGTALGIAVLRKIPEKAFGRVVSVVVIVIAILLLVRPPSGGS